jgi:hypothetical protein
MRRHTMRDIIDELIVYAGGRKGIRLATIEAIIITTFLAGAYMLACAMH